MGTDVHVVVVGSGDDAPAGARRRVESLETRWSRFLPDSEVSRLNDHHDVPVRVSPETFALVALAVDGWRLTEGRFDPTVLDAVVAAGYDRTFEDLGPLHHAVAAPQVPGAGGIRLDPAVRAVTLPAGVGFDPGGIGKGHAADLVATDLVAGGAAGALVNIGGDLRAFGADPDGAGWLVDVESPHGREPRAVVATIVLTEGAVATTTSARRRWNTDTGVRHHVIDPATGDSACSDVASVTVVAGAAWHAEVMSKAAFVAGAANALALLADAGLAGLVVDTTGGVHCTRDLETRPA